MALVEVRTASERPAAEAQPGVTTLAPQPVQLGRYRVLSPVGAGGMAAVYAGEPIDEPGRLVAIKVMLPHLARDQRFAAMFLDEARIACQVASPHVVRSYDYGSEQGALYLVMDFVPGVSLRELMLSASDAGESLAPPVAAAILLDAARGLSAAHGARAHDGTPLGIVHRDVSPHNVLLGRDGRARMSDFGVAYAVDRLSRTTTGGVKGKPGYVSPEHFDQERVDQRSDIFCLGVVAWECFAGRGLFRAAHPLAQLRQVLTAEIPRLDRERPELGAELANVVARALTRDLDERTASMEAFVAELEAAAQARFGIATPDEVKAAVERLCESEIREVDASIARARARRTTGPSAARLRRYVPWFGAAAGAVAALLAGLSGSPEPVRAGTQQQVVPATAMTALGEAEAPTAEPPRELPPSQELTAVSESPSAPRAEPPRTAPRKVKARAQGGRKAKARVQAARKAKGREDDAAGSPLLDVGAFERARKRRD